MRKIKIKSLWPFRAGRRRPSLVRVLAASFLVVGISYLFLVNVVSNKGSQLRSLEIKKQSLAGEIERLEVEAARLQSLAVIEEEASAKIELPKEESSPVTRAEEKVALIPHMVPTTHFQFLEKESGPLAAR